MDYNVEVRSKGIDDNIVTRGDLTVLNEARQMMGSVIQYHLYKNDILDKTTMHTYKNKIQT